MVMENAVTCSTECIEEQEDCVRAWLNEHLTISQTSSHSSYKYASTSIRRGYPANTNNLYNICTMLEQRRRR